MARPLSQPSNAPLEWWQTGWFFGLMVLGSAVPLLWPTVPPLTDLMGHMGRYQVQLSDPSSPLRTRFYDFQWRFIANLGVDLLIVPMSALFGLERGVKLIVILIPMLTVTGMLWAAKEAHGKLPAPALFALPLAYNFLFLWGFVNYLLSMALALNAYALWLRLGHQERWRLRNALFVPIGLILTVTHIFGWAVLCLLAFAAEVVRQHDRGRDIASSFIRGGIACLALAPPILLLLVWRAGEANVASFGHFVWRAKVGDLAASLRNQWEIFDRACIGLLCLLIMLGVIGRGVRINRTLGAAAFILIITYLLLPTVLFGSAFADMRLAPFIWLIATISLTLKSPSRRTGSIVAGVAVILFAVRLSMLTVSFAEHDAANERELQALDHIPRGSRVFVEVALPCPKTWETSRQDHLSSLAIVRRDAFVNGEFNGAGAQLLAVRYRPATGYYEDRTQLLFPAQCRDFTNTSYPSTINQLPRDAFDYVWLAAMPKSQWRNFAGLERVWTGRTSGILYRVIH